LVGKLELEGSMLHLIFGASGSSSFGDSDFSSKTVEGNRVVRSEGSISSDLGIDISFLHV